MSTAAHLLIKEIDPDDPEEVQYRIECRLGTACEGWWQCDERHEIDGVVAVDGPYDSALGAPWNGKKDFEFHGVVHTWHEGYGWTVPAAGCVLEVSDFEPPDEVLSLPAGRFQVDGEWDDFGLYLRYAGPEVQS